MKKSKIIDLINLEIEFCLSAHGTEELESRDFAERLLDKIVEAGMLPPTTKLNKLGAVDNAWETEE